MSSTFATRIKMLREEQKLTQTELATKFDLTKNAISSWQQRDRHPTQQVLIQLATYFNVSLDFLMGVSDDRNQIVDKSHLFKEVKINQPTITKETLGIGNTEIENSIINTNRNSFTQKLVKQIIDDNMISDINNIEPEIIQLLINSLKLDYKQKLKKVSQQKLLKD